MSTTTTMMSNHYRRSVTPSYVGPPTNNKRKERDGFSEMPKPPIRKPTWPIGPAIPRSVPSPPALKPKPNPIQQTPNNQVLAGYLAHEFLTKGTLFGEQWDPARAEAVPVSTGQAEQRRPEHQTPPSSPRRKKKAETSSRPEEHLTEERHRRYEEVADLIKNSGAHLPGIVNPTQLARFLHL